MKLKTIKDEVFQDYKKPAMLLATCYCEGQNKIEFSLFKKIMRIFYFMGLQNFCSVVLLNQARDN